MRTARLTRNESTDEGTFGTIVLDDGWTFCTGELPWRENLSNISCIPTGVFLCRWLFSPRRGLCYHVTNVPNRKDIEIHVANFVGDRAKNFKSEIEGCLALGMYVGFIDNQKALRASKEAMMLFEKNLAGDEFELTLV